MSARPSVMSPTTSTRRAVEPLQAEGCIGKFSLQTLADIKILSLRFSTTSLKWGRPPACTALYHRHGEARGQARVLEHERLVERHRPPGAAACELGQKERRLVLAGDPAR